MPGPLAPPSTALGSRTVVAAQLDRLDGVLTFDAGNHQATVEASMTFRLPTEGYAAFDLRQRVSSARLDGEALPPPALAHHDLGGGPAAEMRVVDRDLAGGTSHVLELAYELGLPEVAEARPVQWGDGTVAFDVWCSDLYPGRYLEQWFPVGLCQDRFTFALEVVLGGVASEHRLVANAMVTAMGENRWRLQWPAEHTSLSSLLLLAPAEDLRTATASADGVTVELTAGPGVEENPAELVDKVAAWLAACGTRLGRYGHGTRFVGHVWEAARGMEYDGAATGSVHSLEHEVFHSWFGRGVKPASASDGWIDEAITTWATSDLAEAPRLAAAALPLDEAPVVLAPPSPWSRHTPAEAYRTGYRLFAGLAHLVGGPEPVLDALAHTYHAHVGGFLSTDVLQGELAERLSVDLGPWWDRYVHGRRPPGSRSAQI
jgi:hypothetical protein